MVIMKNGIGNPKRSKELNREIISALVKIAVETKTKKIEK